ncbi:glycosyltransferase [Vibrio fluvialis]|nr:glycosyltransferase [Vibrio fluvialis]
MNKKKVLIFAGNLRFGGGVAVASSFIKELSLMINNTDESLPNYDLIVSKTVYSNLSSFGVDFSVFNSVAIKDYFGLNAIFQGIDTKIFDYDVVFAVFGPLYSIRKPKNLIVGFAQPWMIYPNSSVWGQLDILERIKSRFKYAIQKKIFLRADTLVVELPHVKDRLLSFDTSKDIRVVNGCIDSVFRDKTKWKSCNIIRDSDSKDFYVGVISKSYIHKNIKFYQLVADELRRRGINNVKFCLTLSESEFSNLGFSNDSHFINVGQLSLDQCPDFYKNIDLVLFPTLLECFSGVCVESIYMNRPIIAFDFQFIKDICGNDANYIKENDYSSCADIIEYYMEKEKCENFQTDVVKKFGDSSRRARDYIDIILSYL